MTKDYYTAGPVQRASYQECQCTNVREPFKNHIVAKPWDTIPLSMQMLHVHNSNFRYPEEDISQLWPSGQRLKSVELVNYIHHNYCMFHARFREWKRFFTLNIKFCRMITTILSSITKLTTIIFFCSRKALIITTKLLCCYVNYIYTINFANELTLHESNGMSPCKTFKIIDPLTCK